MLAHDDPIVSPPIGREKICTPKSAMMPAARNCMPSLIVQSRSQRSSTTPTTTIISVAPRIASTGPESAQTISKNGFAAETPNAATTPRNIAMPPSRGVGVLCTSRSRMPGYSLNLRLSCQTPQLKASVTNAVKMMMKTY